MDILNCKITVFPLDIVFVNFQSFDETQDNRKKICGSFLDYTLMWFVMQKGLNI